MEGDLKTRINLLKLVGYLWRSVRRRNTSESNLRDVRSFQSSDQDAVGDRSLERSVSLHLDDRRDDEEDLILSL